MITETVPNRLNILNSPVADRPTLTAFGVGGWRGVGLRLEVVGCVGRRCSGPDEDRPGGTG
jgi:hypothetical protein